MRSSVARLLIAALIIPVACSLPEDDRPTVDAANLQIQPIGDRLLVLDRDRDRALWLRADRDDARITPLQGDAFALRSHPDGRSLLLLHREEERLERLDQRRNSVGWDLGSAFSGMGVTPDGAHALLFHGVSGGGAAANAGEIAVVDLRADPGEGNPVRRTIHASRSGPSGVTFGPAATLGGATVLPALVHLQGRLALLDVADLTRAETLIPTHPDPDRAGGSPLLIAFEDTPRADGSVVALVLVAGSADLLTVTLSGDAERPADRLPVQVTLNAHATGAGPVGALPFVAPDGRRLALVATSSPPLLHRVDLDTGRVTARRLSGQPSALRRIDLGGPGRSGATAVVSTTGTDVHLITLDDAADDLSGLRSISLLGRPLDLLPCDGFGYLLAPYAGSPGAAFIDLERSDQVIPINLAAAPIGAVVDPALGVAAILDGSSPTRLVEITLADLHPEETELPFRAGGLHSLGAAAALAVPARASDVPEGAVALLPFPLGADNEDAITSLYGLSLIGLLDSAPQDFIEEDD